MDDSRELRPIMQKQETLHTEMAEGELVEIKPLPRLKPLTRLEGTIPHGWKDAIYEPKH